MPEFEVTVVRHAYGFYDTLVEAPTRREAEQLALEEAVNTVVSDKESTYEIWESAHADARPERARMLTQAEVEAMACPLGW